VDFAQKLDRLDSKYQRQLSKIKEEFIKAKPATSNGKSSKRNYDGMISICQDFQPS
jgi:hypothetical protein